MIDKALTIRGYMTPEELTWLAETAKKSKCIVEIGTFYGRSARALADNTEGKLHCIDPYPGIVFEEAGKFVCSGDYTFRQAQKLLKDHIDSGRVSFHRGTVDTFFQKIRPDFIFIDGDHRKDAIVKDIEWAIEMCNDGIIAGHDYEAPGWPDVKEVVDQYFPTIGKEGTIWWTRR